MIGDLSPTIRRTSNPSASPQACVQALLIHALLPRTARPVSLPYPYPGSLHSEMSFLCTNPSSVCSSRPMSQSKAGVSKLFPQKARWQIFLALQAILFLLQTLSFATIASTKAAIDNMKINVHGCVSIKLYLQRQAAGQIWPTWLQFANPWSRATKFPRYCWF